MSEERRLLEAIGILADDWTLGSDDQMACAVEIKAVLKDSPLADIPAQEAREAVLVGALKAQKAAHDYRFGPAGEDAETGEEINAFMLKAQELDEAAWQLTRAALGEKA